MKTIVGERLEVNKRGNMKIYSNGDVITDYNWFDIPDNIEIVVETADLWVENIYSKYKKHNLQYFELNDSVWPKNVSIANLTLFNFAYNTPPLKISSLPRNLRNLWIERTIDRNELLWNQHLCALDLSNCTDLEGLYIPGNELYTLDLSQCKRLRHIDCSDSCITDIKFADNNFIETLNCNNTHIKSLDLSKLKNLIRLHCCDTLIGDKLDLSLCNNLKSVEIDTRNLL